MKALDSFVMGLRSLREHPLETGLLIIGIALASTVASASILLQGSQRIQTDKLLEGPAYREIVVQAARSNNPGANNQSLREVTQDTGPTVNLGDKDVQAVIEQVPSVASAYRFSTEVLRTGTQTAAFLGGPGGGAMVAPAAGNNGAAAASGSTGNVATSNAQSTVPSGRTATDAPPAGEGAPPDGPPQFDQGEDSTLAEGEELLVTDVETFRSLEATAGFFAAYGIEAGEGMLFTDSDTQARAAMVVLGTRLAKRLFPDMDVKDLVNRKIQLSNRIFTISGILSPASDEVSLASGSLLGDLAITPSNQVIIRNGNQVVTFNRGNSTLRFAVAETKDLDEAVKGLEAYFSTTYGAEAVTITVPWEEANLSRNGFDRLLWIIVAFGLGAFVMALINLMNMMLTRSLRRQAAMGILAAMGAARTDLLALQAVEGATMALAGTALGLLGSIPLYGLLYDAGRNLFGIGQGSAPLDAGVFLITAPILALLSVLMAFIPALQVSRLSISSALKAE